jgi:uncharacterized protein YbbC (DUF1343 family)
VLLRRPLLRLKLLALTVFLFGTALLPAAQPRILLGIDVLEQEGFRILAGQRVGLLTNPAGVNRRGESTIDVLRRAPNVRLVALFGPEHGIYGNEKANVPVDNKIDERTGLPVFSLYGKFRRPTPAMLELIDTMVVDLQDIGVRSYTYVSCMRYVMEECFRAGKPVVILDRPNPLGGLKVDGPMLDEEWGSYVSAFPVPYVHGLTIGELARMAKNEPGVMEITDAERRRGQLTIVPMRGWRRDMLWSETGLEWVPTSPAIPDLSAVLGYPMTGLGTQLGSFTHGYGTIYPFRLLQYPGKTPEEIARTFNARRIPGLEFRVLQFTERGEPRRGVYVMVTDYAALRPTELSFHMMQLACIWGNGNPFAAASEGQQRLYNIHVGSTAWWEAITREGARVDLPKFLRQWEIEAERFRRYSERWQLY